MSKCREVIASAVKSGLGVTGVIAASHVVLENRLKPEFAIDADILDAALKRKGNTHGDKNATLMHAVSNGP